MSTITKKQGSQIGLAFGFAAISSFVIVAATPALFPDGAERAAFMVFWSTLFTFAGILTGLNFEVTRAISAARGGVLGPGANETPSIVSASQERSPGKGLHVAWVAAALGVSLSALLAAAGMWWGNWVFPSHGTNLALAVAIGAAGLGVFHGTGGAVAGSGRWGIYAAMITADSALRLLLVIALALTTRSVFATAIGAATAFLVGIAFLFSMPRAREAFSTRINSSLPAQLLRFGAAALANGSSAMLVIGFPTLLSLTTPHEIIDESVPLLLALSLTRAPLMLPLNALQGVVIAHFSRNRSLGMKAMWPIIRVALLVGAIAVAGAWLLGPWLLGAIWGPEMVLSGSLLGALTAGATSLAVVSLTGALCQSLNLQRSFVGGWVFAVIAAALVLLLPLELPVRAALALGIGPLVGIVIHLFALHRASKSAESASLSVAMDDALMDDATEK